MAKTKLEYDHLAAIMLSDLLRDFGINYQFEGDSDGEFIELENGFELRSLEEIRAAHQMAALCWENADKLKRERG